MLNQIPTLPKLDQFVHRFYMYMAVDRKNSQGVIQWKPERQLQYNIDLYQIKHKYFNKLCHLGKDAGMVEFWLDMALYDSPVKEVWEPKNRVERAWEHLSLYCEESCYRAASQVWKESKYQCWEESIFIARCLIYNREKFSSILRKYDPNTSSLHTYMTEVLRKTIKDEGGIAKFSKWRLLYKRSNQELKEALIRYGLFEPDISRFLFARKYFKLVYQMNKIQNPAIRNRQRWIEPDIHDFQEAAQYYNGEKNLAIAPHEVAVGKDITGEELQAWMEICITALQKYPHYISPMISWEAVSTTGGEILSQQVVHPEIAEVILERDHIYQQTETILITNLFALSNEQQEILYLYYGLGWNQQQIAVKFGVTQGAIARRLQTIEKKLIKTLYTLKTPSEWVKSYITAWLKSNYETPHYTDIIHVTLVAAIRKLDVQGKNLLHLRYGQKLEINIISDRLGISIDEVTAYLEKIQCQLETVLIQEVDTMVKRFINIWLHQKCNYLFDDLHKNKLNQIQEVI